MSVVAFLALAALAEPPAAADSCPPDNSGEVIVCGSRRGESPYRLPKLPEKYDAKRIRAETDVIPGVHTRAHVESHGMPDGSRSNRLMITLSTPF